MAPANGCALALGRRMAGVDGVPPINLPALTAVAKESEDAYLAEVLNRVNSRVFETRDVMHYFD